MQALFHHLSVFMSSCLFVLLCFSVFVSCSLSIFSSYRLFISLSFCFICHLVHLGGWVRQAHCILSSFDLTHCKQTKGNKYSAIDVQYRYQYRELMNNNRNCLVGQLISIRYCQLSIALFHHQQDLTICEQKTGIRFCRYPHCLIINQISP